MIRTFFIFYLQLTRKPNFYFLFSINLFVTFVVKRLFEYGLSMGTGRSRPLPITPILHYVSGGAEDLGKIIGFDHGIL